MIIGNREVGTPGLTWNWTSPPHTQGALLDCGDCSRHSVMSIQKLMTFAISYLQ